MRRGISLFIYGLTRKFSILNKIRPNQENTLKMEREKLVYMETLIKLDMIAGITSIFGIRDEVRERHQAEIDELEKKYSVDIRRHIHIGDNQDPDRKRVWDPPLENQTRSSWSFDWKYIQGERVELGPGELPVWHIDRPYLIGRYIDFIYEEFFEKKGEVGNS